MVDIVAASAVEALEEAEAEVVPPEKEQEAATGSNEFEQKCRQI